MADDPDRTGLVSRGEFRRVLMSTLSLNQNQLDAVLSEVCDSGGVTVDYVRFLRRFGRASPALRACSRSRSSVRYTHTRIAFAHLDMSCMFPNQSVYLRRGVQSTSMSLPEIQKLLKDKIGGNLRTVIRVFRLFDYNRVGHIQRNEFHRILDNYCIRLTDKEFQRLWNHYCPSDTGVISYELFLDKLGFGDRHDFKIAPVCTKLDLSSRAPSQCEKVKKGKQRPESPSSSCNAPSGPPHGKLQTLFYDKMCMNSCPVWQALQAFDSTHSGLVKRDVLRAVLSSFIFPMDPLSFEKLTSRYGVRATGPVRWKHFLGHFISPDNEEGDAKLHSDRASEKQPALHADNFDFHNIYPSLKEILKLLVTKEAGCITRTELQHFLESSNGTQPRTPDLARLSSSQITELLDLIDPGCTGVIQLASLERLNPGVSSASTGNEAPPPPLPNTTEPLDVHEDTADSAEEQEPPDSRKTPQWAGRATEASASSKRVESLPLDKLCEQLSSLLAALELCDPEHTGYVSQEDLKKVISSCGMPISDTHFKKLCASSSTSGPGSTSMLVSYSDFLRNLGVPSTDVTHTPSFCCPHKKTEHAERPFTSPQSSLRSLRQPQPSSCQQVVPGACDIQEIVFQRMRSKLDERHISLSDRIQAIIRRADESDDRLSEEDLRKILEDSWVILDHEHFSKFMELLGFRDGWIERSLFQAKYEEATTRHNLGLEVNPLITSAEQVLGLMKARIKIIHGDNLTAFRLMDRKRKGVVDCQDFRVLFNSLRFLCREEEYQRLVDLIGLHPGGNLNYAEFVDIVENGGKRKQDTQTARIQQQLHELLACEARNKWADMSKVLLQYDTESQGWIYKKSLRGFLFTYALPLRADEFEQFWSRYDSEGSGRVAVCDFLEKLGIHHNEELMPSNLKLNQTVSQQESNSPVSADAALLDHIEQVLQENCERVSDALTHLETRDGTVTVEQLLSLLHTYNCSIQREQLVNHLHRLKVSMDDNYTRLTYLEFLSAFNHKVEKKRKPPPGSPDAVHQIESLDNLSPAMALAKIRDLASVSAPNLYKAFSAFDQSGTGVVGALEFRRVLENFCARLSDRQYRYMLTKLELDSEKCTVNWKDFLNKFQSQSPQMLESASGRNTERETNLRSSIQTKTSGVTELLRHVQEGVSGHLHEITKELMELDPSNSTEISKEQFRQLCDRHCLRLTNDQFECVWNQMPVNEQRKLQYTEFLKRFGGLDRNLSLPEPGGTKSETRPFCSDTGGAILHRTKSAPQSSSRRPSSVGRPGTGSPLGSTERRLRGTVQRCWKEIQKKCAEQDAQQDGHIGAASFLEILQSLNINMTQDQFAYLAGKLDVMNDGRVSYQDFLRHFLLNLKPAEAKGAFERRKLPLPITLARPGVLSKDCVEVMLRIYESVRSSWTSVRRCFLASDCDRTGSVTMQDFRRVLHRFKVSLSAEEFFHLSSYFDANTTGKICYDNFLWVFLH
ncbi:EF-hand calcium-binding domain-containing protein 6-like [Mugil cephalus]|uniref:EF-hand calcium-binding domain-containing protein 6-like n=1 Tax=Mugil cephalus TaxID=48193 RepID=UPI001FB725B6|nr:EF-hand calcium-binding domain-containing protein 6-like [Mugil cephalus]